jgi:hypothetical protein
MSLPSWDLSNVPNADQLCWDSAQPGELPTDPERFGWALQPDGYYHRMNPKTLGLIYSARAIGLSRLTEDNLEEWLYRLTCLYELGRSSLTSQTVEGPVPIPFRKEDLAYHVGLTIEVESLSEDEFDHRLRALRMEHLRAGPIE